MMKKILYTLLLTLSMTATAQNYNASDFVDNKAKTEQTEQKTTMTYTDLKGVRYDVYRTKNGALYIKRISKKTGKEYKYYLPKAVQEAMGRKYEEKK